MAITILLRHKHPKLKVAYSKPTGLRVFILHVFHQLYTYMILKFLWRSQYFVLEQKLFKMATFGLDNLFATPCIP